MNDSDKSQTHTEDETLSVLARHEWTLVGMLALLTFVLGVIGYAQTMVFGHDTGSNSWWDPVYASFRLFVFEGPDATGDWPLHLQLARALAPVILIYTAAKAIWQQVRRHVALYLLLFHKRRFVVVCGAGETGFRLARDYCRTTDMRVVVIDSDPMNPLAAELETMGAIVLHGNAIDPVILHQARVIYARELFLCTGDDQANIAIAKNVERQTRHLGTNEIRHLAAISATHEVPGARCVGLRCFLCVDAPDLYEVFANHPFFATSSERYSIRLFNRGETVARNVFRTCAPDLYYLPAAKGPRLHILVVGFEALIRELILQSALTAHYSDFRLPMITVLCPPDCRELVSRFHHRYPHLHQTAELHFVYADPLTVSESQWRDMQQLTPFSVCYTALRRDVESILAARRLNRLRRLASMPSLNFVVLLNQQTFLADILDDNFLPIGEDKHHLPEHEPIEYFEALDETISIDMVVNESLDLFAETLHRAYVDAQTERGDSPQQNASLIGWSELPPHKKKANQRAAAHLDVKLRIAGCCLRDKRDPTPETVFPGDKEMLDVLAQIEHRRWMADKFLSGYSYGTERDEDRMLHPDLISWENLSEPDREKDRDNIRQIVTLAAMRNKKICRAQ